MTSGVTFYLPLEGVIDFDKEHRRLDKAAAEAAAQLGETEGRLADADFTRRASKDKVEEIRLRREDLAGQLARLKEMLESLG